MVTPTPTFELISDISEEKHMGYILTPFDTVPKESILKVSVNGTGYRVYGESVKPPGVNGNVLLPHGEQRSPFLS
jgi:hypothetical protein